MKIANKGRTSPNKGKQLSEEHRKKLSENHRKIQSEETKKKIRETMFKKGLTFPHFKKDKHWNWRGGITHNPYSIDWTRSLRISIRERDHYTCRLCGERQGDRAFSVHHIDYDKKNCDPKNLITLCKICHGKTTTNREYWIIFFKNLCDY